MSEILSVAADILDPELRRYIEANWKRILTLFKPRHIIAFGSRVDKTAKVESDIDLIVVSDSFEGIPFLERSRRFNETVPWHLRVDAWCYTVEEFERKRREIGIVADACREGLWLLRGELLSDEEVEGVMTPEEQAKELIEQAEKELETAKIVYEHDRYDTTVFLAQQAAEKFLKALYLLRFKLNPPRIHDIQSLATVLRAPPEIVAIGKPLTQDYARSRYVDAAGMAPFKVFDPETAKERIAQSEQIRAWVLQQLEQGDVS